jgi:hypothetical protein
MRRSVRLALWCASLVAGGCGASAAVAPAAAPAPACALAPSTCRVAASVTQPLRLALYYTPYPEGAGDDVRRVAEALAAASGGNITVHFVAPPANAPCVEAEAAGVPVVHAGEIGEDGELRSTDVYRGVAIDYGSAHRAIRELGEHAESRIADAIEALVGPPIPLGVLSGHGVLALGTLAALARRYELRSVSAAAPIDPALRALLVIDPRTPISDEEVRNVASYVAAGGSLGVYGGTLAVDADHPPDVRVTPTGAGVDRLLADWGVQVGEDVAADAQCGRVPFHTSYGDLPVPYPPAPIVTYEAASGAILPCDGSVTMFFASPITTTPVFAERGGFVLATTSGEAQSWRIAPSADAFTIREASGWRTSMEQSPHGRFPIAVAAESGDSRLLVVGTASLVLDAYLPSPAQLDDETFREPLSFTVDTLDWLAHADDRASLRRAECHPPS